MVRSTGRRNCFSETNRNRVRQRTVNAAAEITPAMAEAGAEIILDAELDKEYGAGAAATARRVYIAMRILELARPRSSLQASNPGNCRSDGDAG
jgi:hypothetical protein